MVIFPDFFRLKKIKGDLAASIKQGLRIWFLGTQRIPSCTSAKHIGHVKTIPFLRIPLANFWGWTAVESEWEDEVAISTRYLQYIYIFIKNKYQYLDISFLQLKKGLHQAATSQKLGSPARILCDIDINPEVCIILYLYKSPQEMKHMTERASSVEPRLVVCWWNSWNWAENGL